MLDVPFFKQDKVYTCGPTSLQMIFRFYGHSISEAKLAEMLGTNDVVGTRHGRMIDVARELGFFVYVNEASSLDEVSYFIDSLQVPMIAHFVDPSVDLARYAEKPSLDDEHYAVVIGVDDTHVVFNDPWNGEGFRMERDAFEDRWRSKMYGHERWIMAVSDEEIPLGKEYSPTE